MFYVPFISDAVLPAASQLLSHSLILPLRSLSLFQGGPPLIANAPSAGLTVDCCGEPGADLAQG